MGREGAEKFTDRDLFFDFYAKPLTEHQRHISEAIVFLDCSLSEVAKEAGISHQGVSGLVHHTGERLYTYEGKLHLVGEFRKEQRTLTATQAVCVGGSREAALPTIWELTDKLLQLTAH